MTSIMQTYVLILFIFCFSMPCKSILGQGIDNTELVPSPKTLAPREILINISLSEGVERDSLPEGSYMHEYIPSGFSLATSFKMPFLPNYKRNSWLQVTGSFLRNKFLYGVDAPNYSAFLSLKWQLFGVERQAGFSFPWSFGLNDVRLAQYSNWLATSQPTAFGLYSSLGLRYLDRYGEIILSSAFGITRPPTQNRRIYFSEDYFDDSFGMIGFKLEVKKILQILSFKSLFLKGNIDILMLNKELPYLHERNTFLLAAKFGYLFSPCWKVFLRLSYAGEPNHWYIGGGFHFSFFNERIGLSKRNWRLTQVDPISEYQIHVVDRIPLDRYEINSVNVNLREDYHIALRSLLNEVRFGLQSPRKVYLIFNSSAKPKFKEPIRALERWRNLFIKQCIDFLEKSGKMPANETATRETVIDRDSWIIVDINAIESLNGRVHELSSRIDRNWVLLIVEP